ncbi:MAG: nucleotide exchange factor GrpE [Deltaproteobacteria bacterium]|nr:nucleotide exchange factor GrpE [Deltaproteobacteria bacterium]
METKGKKIDIEEEKSASPEKKEKKAAPKEKKTAKKKEVELLKEQIAALEKEKNEIRDNALRATAETENFKKRLTREKEDFVKYSNEKVIKEFLPVVDNLERAVEHAKEAGEGGSLLEGVEMTLDLFKKALANLGVTQVSALGEPFNPERHEAVQQIESADHEPNIVVSEFQKGYMLHERLIRPAMVVVSKTPAGK